jgi:hypothetical protein
VTQMTGGEFWLKCLREEGVRILFGVLDGVTTLSWPGWTSWRRHWSVPRSTDLPHARTGSWDGLAATAQQIEGLGVRALPVRMDVTDAASIRAAVAQPDAAFGRLDILVYNAGLAIDPSPVLQMEDSAWRQRGSPMTKSWGRPWPRCRWAALPHRRTWPIWSRSWPRTRPALSPGRHTISAMAGH